MSISQKIVDKLESLIPDDLRPAPLHEPYFCGNEWEYVKNCIDSGWVSSVGSYVDKFEKLLSEYTGTKHAIVTGNGTSALHTCLKLIGIGVGDEVLCPALTFVATANAISHCEAKPVFVDCEKQTLGVNADKLDKFLARISEKKEGITINKKTKKPIKAVIITHVFGFPAEIEEIKEVADKYKITLIEDAAEGLGSYYKGKHVGNFGLLSALSFNGNKTITTGGGGAIITNDEKLGKRAKHITTTARVVDGWEFYHDEVGYNYRLPNINAALGCAQIEKLPEYLKNKRLLAQKYIKAFENVEGVRIIREPEYSTSNYWLNALLLDKKLSDKRDEILSLCEKKGFICRPIWKLLHTLPMYKDCMRDDLSISEEMIDRVINVPSGPKIASVIAGEK